MPYFEISRRRNFSTSTWEKHNETVLLWRTGEKVILNFTLLKALRISANKTIWILILIYSQFKSYGNTSKYASPVGKES